MTYEEFAKALKALLRKAEEAGLEVDQFCAIAEHILATSWAEED